MTTALWACRGVAAMRRRPLLASGIALALGSGCLEAADVVQRGTVTAKRITGELDAAGGRVTGVVVQWFHRDGDVDRSGNADDGYPSEPPITVDDGLWRRLEENHAPLTLRLVLCDSPDATDGDCTGVRVDREQFDAARLGERATITSL